MASAGDVSDGDYSVYRLRRDDVSGIGGIIMGCMVSAMMVVQRNAVYRIHDTRRSTTRSRSSVRIGIDNGGLPLRLIKSIHKGEM